MRFLLVLFFSITLATASCANDFKADGFFCKKNADGKSVTITYEGKYPDDNQNEYVGDIVIPSTITYKSDTYKVTAIGEAAFFKNTQVNSIVIPSSVKTIGLAAFSQCRGLKSITIPNSVTSIGENAFSMCSNLTSITLPDSITEIPSGIFGDCFRLESITIPNSVTKIGQYAFHHCSGLTSVTLPESLTTIGDCAFMNCVNLKSINLPESVTEIGDYAFNSCDNLKDVAIPSGAHVGMSAFEHSIEPSQNQNQAMFQEITAILNSHVFPPDTKGPNGEKVYLPFEVEIGPSLPENGDDFSEIVQKNFNYPKDYKKNDDFQNFIIVRYIVGMDGKLSNVSIVRGVNAEFDKEALRIISILPTLIPAKINGKPVSSWDIVPIALH